jgi:hypothetical protein
MTDKEHVAITIAIHTTYRALDDHARAAIDIAEAAKGFGCAFFVKAAADYSKACQDAFIRAVRAIWAIHAAADPRYDALLAEMDARLAVGDPALAAVERTRSENARIAFEAGRAAGVAPDALIAFADALRAADIEAAKAANNARKN